MTKLKFNIAGSELDYEGTDEFLESKVLVLMEKFKESNNTEAKRKLLNSHDDILKDFLMLESHNQNLSKLFGEQEDRMKEYTSNLSHLIKRLRTSSNNSSEILKITEEIEVLHESTQINMLQLQSQMERETRFLNAISNMMKTIHDTTKAIINNIK